MSEEKGPIARARDRVAAFANEHRDQGDASADAGAEQPAVGSGHQPEQPKAEASDSKRGGDNVIGDARLAEELFSIADLLEEHLDVRRALADSGSRGQARAQLAERLFGSQVQSGTLDALKELVTQRWSSPRHLVVAVDRRGSDELLASADGHALDDVEDELFRFGRTIEREARLSLALSDPGLPAERKDQVVERLLGDRVQPVTLQLVRRVVHHPRGRSVPRALEDLARMAAERRQRSIAEVTVAHPLDADQQARLRDAVSRAFGREVELQVFVDPGLLGGVVVRIGDEVVDGSVLRRLGDARRKVVR